VIEVELQLEMRRADFLDDLPSPASVVLVK
jgi:hypothetical protein